MNRQKELRSLLRDSKTNKKLPSKLCGYNNKHQLICKICKTVIKSTTFWKTHERSTKHKQTLNQLLKMKTERDKKLTENNNEKNENINNISNENISKQKENKQMKEMESKTNENENKSKKETDKKEEILIDGIPLNFFDKSMEHKKPKNKKEIIIQKDKKKELDNTNGNKSHFVVIESDNNKNKDKNKNITIQLDETDKELLKIENELKIEKEDELLEFVVEMDKQMENEENKQIEYKINTLNEYRNKLNKYKKRDLEEIDNNNEINPQKKRKITNVSDTNNSECDEIDIFDSVDWRAQKI